MRRLVSLAALAAGSVSPALAADAAPAGQPAEQIVVTGTGLPETPAAPAYDVQQIPRERLLVSASGRIDDALGAAAGVQQFRRSDSRSSNPSAQGITLRALGGNATSRTLVLLDGVPMADPFFGYIPLSAIAPERLGNVNVIRGGGAGAFGAGAVAGTIAMTSAGPDQLGLLTAAGLVNDRGETELSGSLAPKLGQGFAVVSGRWDRGKGFWTTPESQRGPASVRARFDSWSTSLRAVAPLGADIELQARVAAFEDNRTLRFKGADTGMSGQDASLRLVGRGDWQFDALAYLQSRDFHNVVVSSAAPFARTLDQTSTPSTGAGGKIELRPPVGEAHVLRLGADWRYAQGTANETRLVPSTLYRSSSGTNTDLGLFAEDDWTVGELVLTAGARADRWTIRKGRFRATSATGSTVADLAFADRSGWAGSFRGGAVLHALPTLDLRGAAYSNIRQPTLNELYRTFVVSGVTTNRNPDLGNERLVGFEAGVDLRPIEGLALGLTAFDNEVRHAIANVTINLATGERQRQNVDAVHARGLEANAAYTTERFSLAGSLSYTDAHVRAAGGLDGKRPSQTPRWAASATASWQPAERWRLALTLRHVGQQYEDDLESDSLPPATTLDAFAQVPLSGPFSLMLRAENLTDEVIVTRNSGNTQDLGVPRTVWAGLRIDMR